LPSRVPSNLFEGARCVGWLDLVLPERTVVLEHRGESNCLRDDALARRPIDDGTEGVAQIVLAQERGVGADSLLVGEAIHVGFPPG
jgi:hypothetical protein